MAMAAPSAHRGGVAIFYRKAEHFATKELHLHGPNVISFQMVTGRRRCRKIEEVATAIRGRPYGSELLVARNLNANL